MLLITFSSSIHVTCLTFHTQSIYLPNLTLFIKSITKSRCRFRLLISQLLIFRPMNLCSRAYYFSNLVPQLKKIDPLHIAQCTNTITKCVYTLVQSLTSNLQLKITKWATKIKVDLITFRSNKIQPQI